MPALAAPTSPLWGGRTEGPGGGRRRTPTPLLRSDLPGRATGLARLSDPHKGEDRYELKLE